jgi:hypothetical protein
MLNFMHTYNGGNTLCTVFVYMEENRGVKNVNSTKKRETNVYMKYSNTRTFARWDGRFARSCFYVFLPEVLATFLPS